MVATDLDVLDEAVAATPFSEIIATVITTLKEEDEAAYESQTNGHTWKFKYGTVTVLVHLTGEAENDSLTIWSPVLSLPAKDEATLLRELLVKNWDNTLEARFAIWNDEVVMHTTRQMLGITPGEISHLITLVATLADEYDEPLQEAYSL